MTTITRNTNETQIELALDLYSDAGADIESPVPFLNHMLTLFARHAGVGLRVRATGDTEIDGHHTVEDIGITLGQAISGALGEKKGIARYGDALIPMDEALVLCALDLSGRGHLSFDAAFPTQRVGAFDLELVEEFFTALVRSAGITLHLKQMAGKNSHHIAEACFKAFAHAFRKALEKTGDTRVLSTKGVLE